MPEYKSPEEEILAQAKAMNKNIMEVPEPPKTGNLLKDFIIQALMQAPMGLGPHTNSPMTNMNSRALSISNGVNRGPNMYNPLRYQFIGKPVNNNINLKSMFPKNE